MELLDFINNFSLDILGVAFVIFILTMFIKLPIKKATSKLSEEKRKAINSVIIVIPAILSFILTTLFSGMVNNNWFSITIIENSITSCLLSISIYILYQRIVIVIKGFISGQKTLNETNLKEAISTIKNDIKSLNLVLKNNEIKLKDISKKILSLNDIKNKLESTTRLVDLNSLSETNIKIQELTEIETKLEEQIDNTRKQINEYELKLNQL